MKDDVAVKVDGVSKSFALPHEKRSSVKSLFVSMFRGRRTYEKQHVLKNVSFEIKRGEFFGIVGRNGSGKSTLLKMLAGIYSPDKGSITINGKLVPFIELGVGFNPELTGRENVFLNGALLGFSRKEMAAMYDEIVDFAELHRFMDQKLKNYSSGMQVRLAFSIAIRANTDILVLDEVLAVGDYNFQQKCFEYFRDLKRQKKTVILVSHDSNAIQMFCTGAILVENGEIKEAGDASKVLKAYAEQNQSDLEKIEAKRSKTNGGSKIEKGTGLVQFVDLRVANEKKQAKVFAPREPINISVKFKFKEDIKDPVFGVVIQDTEGGQPIFATNTLDMGIKTGSFKKGQEKTVTFTVKNVFNDGKYFISGAVASTDRSALYVRFMNVASFSSIGWNNVTARSRVYLDHAFKVR